MPPTCDHKDALCICPKCGHESPKPDGARCQHTACPACGARKMLRKGGKHHKMWLAKRAEKY